MAESKKPGGGNLPTTNLSTAPLKWSSPPPLPKGGEALEETFEARDARLEAARVKDEASIDWDMVLFGLAGGAAATLAPQAKAETAIVVPWENEPGTEALGSELDLSQSFTDTGMATEQLDDVAAEAEAPAPFEIAGPGFRIVCAEADAATQAECLARASDFLAENGSAISDSKAPGPMRQFLVDASKEATGELVGLIGIVATAYFTARFKKRFEGKDKAFVVMLAGDAPSSVTVGSQEEADRLIAELARRE